MSFEALGTKIAIFEPLLSPPVRIARRAHMHRFLSVRHLTKIHWTKIHISESIIARALKLYHNIKAL